MVGVRCQNGLSMLIGGGDCVAGRMGDAPYGFNGIKTGMVRTLLAAGAATDAQAI